MMVVCGSLEKDEERQKMLNEIDYKHRNLLMGSDILLHGPQSATELLWVINNFCEKDGKLNQLDPVPQPCHSVESAYEIFREIGWVAFKESSMDGSMRHSVITTRIRIPAFHQHLNQLFTASNQFILQH